MIVEDDLDRSMGRIGGVEQLKKLDELPAAMPVPDQGMDLPGKQIDACQQTDRAVTFVVMIRATVACTPGCGGRSGAVLAIAQIRGASHRKR